MVPVAERHGRFEPQRSVTHAPLQRRRAIGAAHGRVVHKQCEVACRLLVALSDEPHAHCARGVSASEWSDPGCDGELRKPGKPEWPIDMHVRSRVDRLHTRRRGRQPEELLVAALQHNEP